MRIVTDFDGVLTHQDQEAAEVGARLEERLTEAYDRDAQRGRDLLADIRARVRSNPTRHGWFVGDAIGCYADEDPFVFNNACCRALFLEGPSDAPGRLAAQGMGDWETLARACFEEGTARWRAANSAHVLQDALEALRRLLSAGIEVVVVSNSSTDRIRSILEPSGILHSSAGKLRLRGDAKKFHVTGDRPANLPAAAPFGGRSVLLRRGSYYDILAEEEPDAVIGDVLSLDVALPAMLREMAAAFEEMTVCLRRHPHTPAWALEACAAKDITVVDSFAELPGILAV